MSFSDEEYIEELEKEVALINKAHAQQGVIILELQRKVSLLQETIVIMVQDNQLKGTN